MASLASHALFVFCYVVGTIWMPSVFFAVCTKGRWQRNVRFAPFLELEEYVMERVGNAVFSSRSQG